MKKIITAVVIVSLAYLTFVAATKKNEPEVANDMKANEAVPVNTNTYVWKFEDMGTDANSMPTTKVTLTVNGKSYDAGSYSGSCVEVKAGAMGVTGELADAGEVSRVQCWFAGGGNEVGVYDIDGKVVLKVGEVGEGEVGGAPFRGNFKTLLEI